MLLLDMLRAMRLTGGIFLDAEFTAPWCVTAKVGPEDCIPFTPEPRHIIAYHYVTAGRFLLKVGHQPPVPVESGEIVVLPRNDDHVIGSALESPSRQCRASDPTGGGGRAGEDRSRRRRGADKDPVRVSRQRPAA